MHNNGFKTQTVNYKMLNQILATCRIEKHLDHLCHYYIYHICIYHIKKSIHVIQQSWIMMTSRSLSIFVVHDTFVYLSTFNESLRLPRAMCSGSNRQIAWFLCIMNIYIHMYSYVSFLTVLRVFMFNWLAFHPHMNFQWIFRNTRYIYEALRRKVIYILAVRKLELKKAELIFIEKKSVIILNER